MASRDLGSALSHLKSGGLVAFPTETVYGLGADAANPEAVERLFQAKGRPSDNPLPLVVSGKDMARPLVSEWPEAASRLARAFWPGPLSIVFPKAAHVPDRLTAGRPTVSLRCPDQALTLALLALLGHPIAGPSANPSGKPPPTSAAQVAAYFGPESGVIILDGGPCRVGVASTVAEITAEGEAGVGGVVIHRAGTITAEQIHAALA